MAFSGQRHITIYKEFPAVRQEPQSQSTMAHFRTELHIPVKKDSLTFEDRQMKTWENVQTELNDRRSQWDKEFEKMRNDFFTLAPTDTSSDKFSKIDAFRSLYEFDDQGNRKFKVRFDVSDFSPEEIQVKVQDNKVVIFGKTEEKKGNSTFSREYSRQIDIPRDVDQDKITCVMSKDNILTVEGPMQQSSQNKETTTFLPIKCETVPNLTHKSTVQNSIITEPDGARKLHLQVDIGEYKPEDIVVKTMDRKLIVTARHEEKMEGRTVHKEFNKEFELPETVDPMSVNAFLSEDGKLTIEAPLKAARRPSYTVTQSSDVRKMVVTKESQFTITDSTNRPMVTINVHPR